MNFDHYSIRLLRADDLNSFFQLIERNRKRLEDFFRGTVARTRTFDDTQAYMEEIFQKIENKSYLPFVLVDNENDLLIGFFDIKNIDWTIPKAELGYFMDEAYAGKGIAGKALAEVTRYCFTDLAVNKLFLRTHESNIASRKIAEKCGFEVEGTIRRDYKTTAGEVVDLLYYGKISGN